MSQKHGAFARVVPSTTPHRIIKIPHSDDPGLRYHRAIENEASILQLLTKKKLSCIPLYYGKSSQGTLQMQYLPVQQVDVLSYLKTLDISQFHDFLMHSFTCLESLHRHILHMDLHNENLMFRAPTHQTPFPQLVFIDFGYSITLKDALHRFPPLKGGPSNKDLIELYKKYERYQLFSILLELYEETQDAQDRVQAIRQISNLGRGYPFTRQEKKWIDDFHDTSNVMINNGKW